MYDAMLAETVTIRGDGGDEIEAYLARPMRQGPLGGVVVIHHMPGYDEPTKEIARTFAVHGYNALMPNLYHRDAPGASPDDAAAAARAQGGVPDARLIGDVAGAAAHLRGLTSRQRQGRRHRVLLGRPPVGPGRVQPAARRGGRLLRRVRGRHPAGGHAAEGRPHQAPHQGPVLPAARPVRRGRPVPVAGAGGRARAGAEGPGQDLRVPLLRGRRSRVLLGQPPAYRPEAAMDGWQRIFTWFGRYLS